MKAYQDPNNSHCIHYSDVLIFVHALSDGAVEKSVPEIVAALNANIEKSVSRVQAENAQKGGQK